MRNCPLLYPEPVTATFRFAHRWAPDVETRCPRANYLRCEPLLWLQADCEAYGVLPRPGGPLAQPNRLMQALRLVRSEIKRIQAARLAESAGT